MASDLELTTRTRSGDRAALDELYRRYLPAVWRYACAELRPDQAAARDAVSETFLAALRDIRRFDPAHGSVAAWLMGIARHKIADHRRLRLADELPEDAPAPPGTLDPAAPVEHAETRAAVVHVMLALEDEHRLVLEWKYLEDLSVRDIAQRLARTEKATEALLFRARAAFRQREKTLKGKEITTPLDIPHDLFRLRAQTLVEQAALKDETLKDPAKRDTRIAEETEALIKAELQPNHEAILFLTQVQPAPDTTRADLLYRVYDTSPRVTLDALEQLIASPKDVHTTL